MHIAGTASSGATDRADGIPRDDEVLWLQPREMTASGSRSRALTHRSFRGVAASLAVGVALNLSVSGIPFAPSAQALGDEGPTVSVGETYATIGEELHAPSLSSPKVTAKSISASETSDTLDQDTAPECDESEVAERHRSEVRRLLADALGNPNEPIEFGAVRIPRRIVQTILRASEVTNVDPVYMMALADKESSFSVDVKASTSSAEGLFQFIAKTWLEVVREFGPRHGLHAEAAAIEIVDGEPKIADDGVRERVLGLRRDPYFAAVMAAELLKKDRASIEQRIGRELRHTEFYLAHFFGADAAGRFMKLLDGKPKQSAPRIFPQAAKANKALFFARKGRKTKDLSVAEVYAKIDRMIDARIGRYRAVTSLSAPEQPSI